MEKYCSRCNTTKDHSEFGNKQTEVDHKQLWCKKCTYAYYNEWRVNNRNKSKPIEIKQFDTFYNSIHGRAVHMLNNLRTRAKKKNIPFNISINWIESKLIDGKCEASGLNFVIRKNGGKGHRNNSFSPSIDRLDQTGPYTEDNCQMTCWIYNRAKGAFPLADLITMMKSYLETNKSTIDITNES